MMPHMFYIAPFVIFVLNLNPKKCVFVQSWSIRDAVINTNENFEANANLEEGDNLQISTVQGQDRSLRGILDLFRNILSSSSPPKPSTSLNETGSEGNYSANSTTSSPVKMLPLVIINEDSIFPIQFYNSDFEASLLANDTENMTEPNVIFGSPLCLGLCFNAQVYAENTSVRLLSDKQYSLFPPKPVMSGNESVTDRDPADSSSIIPIQIHITPENNSNPSSHFSIIKSIASWIHGLPRGSLFQRIGLPSIFSSSPSE